jgi:hypothetical protein
MIYQWLTRNYWGKIRQVKVHLPGVCIVETSGLEVNYHQAFQASVEEQQIDPKPAITDAQAALPACYVPR